MLAPPAKFFGKMEPAMTSPSDFRVTHSGSLIMRRILIMVSVLFFAASAFGRMTEEPKSFALQDKSQERVLLHTLPGIDAKRLLAEDLDSNRKQRERPGPQRFAVPADVNLGVTNSGTWQKVPDGRIWRLRIRTPGAKNMNLGITRFDVPKGAKLWVYNPQHTQVEGAYTGDHRNHQGGLWTPVIDGEEIVIELFVPNGATQPNIEIRKVNQGYRGLIGGGGDKTGLFGGNEGACNNDVVCPVGDPWRDQIRAIGVYTINGTSGCTGNLVNSTGNTAGHFIPYILSANHCGMDSTNDASVVFYWNFQSASCGTHGPGSTADNQSGAIYRASYAPSDFLLFELQSPPDPSYNVYHSGWDASGSIPTRTVGIHHPSLDVKAISFSNSAPDTTAYSSPIHDPNGNHWYVHWDSGVTEGGSSGSCLFDDNNRCIGQLHGGPSGCGGTDLHDYYGRLSVSWTGGGTNSTRLSNWLDPLNLGISRLDGDPHITTVNGAHYEFQGAGEFVSLRDPNGVEIQVRQEPVSAPAFGPDSSGLTTCVSLNTAVAAHVGGHRVTYQPNISGDPDPSGLQLRVDGVLKQLGNNGLAVGAGHITKTAVPGGLQIEFPDDSTLLVTPGWWPGPNKWYLNVQVVRPRALSGGGNGSFPTGGIAGAIPPNSWLPLLPDGASMGPKPASLHQRYVDLYQKFGNAWRVSNQNTLFDYAAGTSTATFTNKNWPPESGPCNVGGQKVVIKPIKRDVAVRACGDIADPAMKQNCIFDVMAAGHTGFAATYLKARNVLANASRILVVVGKPQGKAAGTTTLTAKVSRIAGGEVRDGQVQFMVDGKPVGEPVSVGADGEAEWSGTPVGPGPHEVSASYVPRAGSALLPSISRPRSRIVVPK